jgi:hypothetical protein
VKDKEVKDYGRYLHKQRQPRERWKQVDGGFTEMQRYAADFDRSRHLLLGQRYDAEEQDRDNV